ncbi:MAG: hypothetical protein H6R26_1367 [Proteobacteria bacterium]|nr:hypothetical protein [Pseudomonadota bacterium]
MAIDNRKVIKKAGAGGNVIWIKSPARVEPPLARGEPPIRRLERLPRDVGWMLFGVGFAGFVAPGVFGLPFMVAGGMILWPKTTERLQRLAGLRSGQDAASPGMKQIGRFLDDLERRYPSIDEA